MAATAAYDEIADWYEGEFLPRTSADDPLGVDRSLRDLLGPGDGTCREIGPVACSSTSASTRASAARVLVPERFAESGGSTPVVLALRARVPTAESPN